MVINTISLVLDKIKGKYSGHHSLTLLQVGNLPNRQNNFLKPF